MSPDANKKRRFPVKSRLLSLYLSIGIIGIGMLAFSAWTPSSVRTGAAANPDHLLNAEHTPSNSTTDGTVSDTQNVTASPGHTDPQTPGSDNITDAVVTPSVTPVPATPTPSPSPTPVPNPLLTDAYAEVNQLVKSYYDAKLSDDAAVFDSLVSDPSTIDIDYLHIQYSLVTEFSNFTCYTKRGINEVAYVVYVGYDSKIVTIDTPVPALDRLTLVYADDGSGKLLINTASDLSDEATAYCDELSSHEDVQEMYLRETKRFEDAIASDPELSQLYNRLDTEGAN